MSPAVDRLQEALQLRQLVLAGMQLWLLVEFVEL
jgi:hypothetical protein